MYVRVVYVTGSVALCVPVLISLNPFVHDQSSDSDTVLGVRVFI